MQVRLWEKREYGEVEGERRAQPRVFEHERVIALLAALRDTVRGVGKGHEKM
jgi:hypothetical protein